MKKRILVPVDNTPVTQDVIKVADFWGQKLDAKLLFLHARSAEIQKLVDRGELINPKEGFEQPLENTPCESENEIVYRCDNPYQTILDAEQEFVPEIILEITSPGILFLFLPIVEDNKISLVTPTQSRSSIFIIKAS